MKPSPKTSLYILHVDSIKKKVLLLSSTKSLLLFSKNAHILETSNLLQEHSGDFYSSRTPTFWRSLHFSKNVHILETSILLQERPYSGDYYSSRTPIFWRFLYFSKNVHILEKSILQERPYSEEIKIGTSCTLSSSSPSSSRRFVWTKQGSMVVDWCTQKDSLWSCENLPGYVCSKTPYTPHYLSIRPFCICLIKNWVCISICSVEYVWGGRM